jgi:hypothetical protein
MGDTATRVSDNPTPYRRPSNGFTVDKSAAEPKSIKTMYLLRISTVNCLFDIAMNNFVSMFRP